MINKKESLSHGCLLNNKKQKVINVKDKKDYMSIIRRNFLLFKKRLFG